MQIEYLVLLGVFILVFITILMVYVDISQAVYSLTEKKEEKAVQSQFPVGITVLNVSTNSTT